MRKSNLRIESGEYAQIPSRLRCRSMIRKSLRWLISPTARFWTPRRSSHRTVMTRS